MTKLKKRPFLVIIFLAWFHLSYSTRLSKFSPNILLNIILILHNSLNVIEMYFMIISRKITFRIKFYLKISENVSLKYVRLFASMCNAHFTCCCCGLTNRCWLTIICVCTRFCWAYAWLGLVKMRPCMGGPPIRWCCGDVILGAGDVNRPGNDGDGDALCQKGKWNEMI